jgi:alpha-ketoglutarate-dependent taurine dioxygenase
MATAVTADPRNWRADTIDSTDHWYYPLSPECLNWLDQALDRPLNDPANFVSLRLSDFPGTRPDWLAPAAEALEQGRGFAILTGLDPNRYSRAQQQLAYWLVGQLLGEPMAQNIEGTLLYDVRDTGKQLTSGARFSVTNYESSFHTDNSFGDEVLDYVGLLCLRSAKSGGLSQVLSGLAVHEVLEREQPELLRVLYEPFCVDRRGGVKPGEAATALIPIFRTRGNELLVRYLRYWIEVGHEKVQLPLTPLQLRALDELDAVLRRPELRVEFMLEPGEMFFINNRWIFHNRTAFEDHQEFDQRRHYVRLWLQARSRPAA